MKPPTYERRARMSNGPHSTEETRGWRNMQPLPVEPDAFVELPSGGHLELYRDRDIVRRIGTSGGTAWDIRTAEAAELAEALSKLTGGR